jgi:hypothetical protein
MALRAYLEGLSSPKRDYPVETHLVVRESTSFPRGPVGNNLRVSRSLLGLEKN